MNMHVAETGKLPTQAQIIAIQMRLGKNAKAAPIERRKRFVHVRDDADYHVGAWQAWQRICDPMVTPVGFIKAKCRIAGVSYDDLMCLQFRRFKWLRKPLMHEVAERFPRLTCTQIGHLFNRHHTTVLSALGRRRHA